MVSTVLRTTMILNFHGTGASKDNFSLQDSVGDLSNAISFLIEVDDCDEVILVATSTGDSIIICLAADARGSQGPGRSTPRRLRRLGRSSALIPGAQP